MKVKKKRKRIVRKPPVLTNRTKRRKKCSKKTVRKKATKKADDTGDNRSHLFQPGVSGNPAGRPIGARSQFGLAFYEDLLKVWGEHGEEAMIKVAKHDPATFVRVAASLMPRQVKAEINNMRTLIVELVGADGELVQAVEDKTAIEAEYVELPAMERIG